MDKRTAIITGITGQDGSYLAEFLLEKGYEVHGVHRQPNEFGQAQHLQSKVTFHVADLEQPSQIEKLIRETAPTEYYHLASPSFIAYSHEFPLEASSAIASTVLVALESIRRLRMEVRFFQAGSSEMFGNGDSKPLNETQPFQPMNLYASAKAYAHNMVRNYRDHFGIFACNAILFNHESPRRSHRFVTRKITAAAASIKLGLQSKLKLGDLTAVRDWGFAGDFVSAFWKMLQVDSPSDYVLGTGVLTSVEAFVERAFQGVDLDWRDYVEVDPGFLRNLDKKRLAADSSRAKLVLDWEPSTSVDELIQMMIEHDLAVLKSTHSSDQVKRAA